MPKALGALLFVAFLAAFSFSFDAQTKTTAFADLYSTGFPGSRTQPDAALTNQLNYLTDVTRQGNFTWPLNQMPLRVYIEDGTGTPGYQEMYQDYIRRAFNEWQMTSNGTLTWLEVNSPQQANIICSWTGEARPKGNGVEAGETQTTIQRSPFFPNGRIIAAHVVVLTCLFGRPFSNADLYKTCLHEIGHALGLQGHSSTASDIMYPVLNANQTPYLKDRDRNTIMALYSQTADRSSIAIRDRSARQPRLVYGYPRSMPGYNGWGMHNIGWARGFVFGNFR